MTTHTPKSNDSPSTTRRSSKSPGRATRSAQSERTSAAARTRAARRRAEKEEITEVSPAKNPVKEAAMAPAPATTSPAKASASASAGAGDGTGPAKSPKRPARPAKKATRATTKRTASRPVAPAARGKKANAAAAPAAPAHGTADPAPAPAPFAPIGRIPVIEVSPVIENGAWPAKATVNEAFPVEATVFREGHDAFAATAVLIGPDGRERQRATMSLVLPGLDRYQGWLTPDEVGDWAFRIEGWSDPYASWKHDATIKINAGIDADLMCEEGARVLQRAAEAAASSSDKKIYTEAITALRDGTLTAEKRLEIATSDKVQQALAANPLREMVTASATFPIRVDRIRALVGSWYEIFPRSIGAEKDEDGRWTSGTLRSAVSDLDRIAGMGFDVIYLTPIHPIGTTNRKGRNNTLTAREGDPGSPYGIGAPAGGHEAIHPDLGTFADFDYFVEQARERGMEVALDLALQCSPDHPWVKEHPDWFTARADGSIAYAENPPKKYQDIYPLNFDRDPEGIYQAIVEVTQKWIDHGVTIFRVDNPHTKPLSFWQRYLAHFRTHHPEVIFLAEAFTRPAMMRTLGAIGFHQSYTYFTWRRDKDEIAAYLCELARGTASHMRPAFWPTTHDILTADMQRGGVPAFAIRAILAATGSPTWGIYSGYELVENVARPGFEEQIDNEKYEFRPRDYSQAEVYGIAPLLRRLNEIRASHTALQRLRDITIHPTTDDHTLAFSRRARAEECPDGKENIILTVINLDPYATREAVIDLNVEALGGQRPPAGSQTPLFEVHDELSGETYQWGPNPFVRLSPQGHSAHIMTVRTL